MSGKYSDSRFFFAHYGCCVPTESYAWILVVMFITTVLVLLFCMLATAVIRWMYKRRMRKRLHDLKRKFVTDQLQAQEFDAKLNYMAQNNRRGGRNEEPFAKENGNEKFTIFVDPAQNCAAQHLQNSGKDKKKISNSLGQKVATPAMDKPIYDADDTPIAQSSLASQSDLKKHDSRFAYLPKNQRPRQVSDDETQKLTPIFLPQPYKPSSQQGPPPMLTRQPFHAQKTSPPKKPLEESPEKKKMKDDLAPPAAISFSKLSPSTVTTSGPSTVDTTGSSGNSTDPTTRSNTSNVPSGTSEASITNPILHSPPSKFDNIPSPPKAFSDDLRKSPDDDVKQNPQYGMDIVSPVQLVKSSDKGSDGQKEERKDGAGGRGEWKYYYASGSDGKIGKALSTTTKSSTSHRRSTRSWLFDSTGSNRLEAAIVGSAPKTNSTVSSSILKTDSSHYKTASIETFPHGAFSFQ